jgi:AAA+ superfamily predicted ATPase
MNKKSMPATDEIDSAPLIGPLAVLIGWFEEILISRPRNSGVGASLPALSLPPLPKAFDQNSILGQFLANEILSLQTSAILAAAFAQECDPWIFFEFFEANRDNPTIGIRDAFGTGQLQPSIQTMIFILAGRDISEGQKIRQIFSPDSTLIRKNVIRLTPPPTGGTFTASTFSITPEYLHLFTTGQELKPRFSSEFPAKRMQTTLEWDDLVLSGDARKQVAEIKLWLQHKEAFLGEWEMSRKFKPGYSALFHGPPGTGKTMTASLLGKATGRDIYRIDLSSVISKYIGETEKNLARIFDLAENKEWILFFDEADSLFGKRGKVSDARDRYANQDISFLLQRLEDFNGLSILASNLKSNIDEAFMRRFQAIIYFPLPNPEMRYQLWKQAIPKRAKLERQVKILELAHKYELTGAAIMNVVRHATLQTIDGGDEIMLEEYLMEGIKREYLKVGKVV